MIHLDFYSVTMIFDMKAFGLLLLLAVESKASINKLFFMGSSVDIICPLDASFYLWKKYHNNKMTNLFQEDKRKLNISLKSEESPTDYECEATSGFETGKVNITVYILDRNSEKAQTLCYMEPMKTNSILKQSVQYPCFINNKIQTVTRMVKGSTVTFDCEASGTNVNYIWYKLNTPTSHKDLLNKYNNFTILKINNIDEKSVGQYLCVVSTISGEKLERNYELQLLDESSPDNSVNFNESPETINVTAKLYKSQTLVCVTNLSRDKIQAIKWGKKLNNIPITEEKSTIIHWDGFNYRILPENQIDEKTASHPSNIVSSLTIKEMTTDSSGEYKCAIVTNSGHVKYKIFYVTFASNSIDEENRPSFFFLYILIPSLIIAVCLFIGIYLTINRRPARKASNFPTNTKSETDTTRLRTTPDYSSVQYQANPPTTVQYSTNNSNYYNPYYPSSDKLIV